MKPITIEVVSHLLTTYGHCNRCGLMFRESGLEREVTTRDSEEYPPDLKEEFSKLYNWISELSRLYRHRIRIRLIDAKSPLGIYKALLHRFRVYPTFIIEKKDVYSGWDQQELECLVDLRIRAANH
jgi:hypothetical protein